MIPLETMARLPQCELHLHLEGAFRPETAMDLARRKAVDLGVSRFECLYADDDLPGYLAVSSRFAAAICTASDFERIGCEMHESCAGSGARHVEFFTLPHADDGVPCAVQ